MDTAQFQPAGCSNISGRHAHRSGMGLTARATAHVCLRVSHRAHQTPSSHIMNVVSVQGLAHEHRFASRPLPTLKSLRERRTTQADTLRCGHPWATGRQVGSWTQVSGMCAWCELCACTGWMRWPDRCACEWRQGVSLHCRSWQTGGVSPFGLLTGIPAHSPA